ncbi:unnamed protein product [Caenorhabditis angaria]|uniref:Tyrosine-protein phosphatase domain-containing protein n=1 Tax=Caenorhabditis angaria TaxID=860376 RepID=A0A9P1ISQ3_9PELO|nr:unnamed protein product [Caenorhabditis angaria]
MKNNFSDFSNYAKGKSAGYIKSTIETSNSATFYAFDSNPTLNRYISPKCRDSSRVILENHKTDYINANWVVSDSKEYRGKNILTQAPLKNTIPDFWAMIYQEKVEYIVMFCEFMEKSSQYLPTNEGDVEKYENFEVKFVRKEKDPVEGVNWIILHLFDRKSIDTRPRRVNHIHVTSWAENTTPDDPKLTVELYRWLMRKNESHIPMVFHCNNGIGRSATFAAIYFLIRLDFDEDDLLISESSTLFLQYLNEFRNGAIETTLQYCFIICCIFELLIQENRIERTRDIDELMSDYKKYVGKVGEFIRVGGKEAKSDQIFPPSPEEKRKPRKKQSYKEIEFSLK